MGLDKLIEWVEFSPVGYFVTGVNSYSAFSNFQKFSEDGNIGRLMLGIGSTLLIGGGVYLLQKNARAKKRLEKAFEERGYDERLVKSYLYSWCNRNVVRVVSNKFGFSDEFEDTLGKYNLHWYDVIPKTNLESK